MWKKGNFIGGKSLFGCKLFDILWAQLGIESWLKFRPTQQVLVKASFRGRVKGNRVRSKALSTQLNHACFSSISISISLELLCDQPKPIKINQDLFSILNHSYIYLYFVAGCQSFVPEYVIKTIFVTISFSISLDLLRDGLKVVAKDVHHHVEGVEGEPGGEEDDADRYQQQVCSTSPRQFSSKPNTRKG